jgi:hypothetical protein
VQYTAVTDEVSCSPSYPEFDLDFQETHDISSNEGRYPAVVSDALDCPPFRTHLSDCDIIDDVLESSSEAASTGRLRLACEHFDARCRKYNVTTYSSCERNNVHNPAS